MEKLNFFESLEKCFTLYFKNFGKFFIPFLWPILWAFGAAILMLMTSAVNIALASKGAVVGAAPIVLLVFTLLGLAIYILAFVRLIKLQAATAITTKKLLFEGEEPNYDNALSEVKADGGKLAKTFLWMGLFAIIFCLAAAILPAILGVLLFGSNIPDTYNNFVQTIIIGTLVTPFFLFPFQFFALKKELCAKDCVIQAITLTGKNFLPIALIFFVWNLINFLIATFVPILSLIIMLAILIVCPVFIILATYWYLRFTEESA